MFLGFLQIILEPGNIFFFFSDDELILVGGGGDVEIYNITTGGLSLPHYYLTLFLVAWLQMTPKHQNRCVKFIIYECGASGSSLANHQQRVAIIGSPPPLDVTWRTQGTQNSREQQRLGRASSS